MKTILATTYAVNPYKGSEDGMGWNFICQIARFNKVIAITRENNREAIEQYMLENPDKIYRKIEFHYFDLPYWMRFWKRGGRGAMLYFWMWQRAIPGFVARQNIQFDIAHNLNFHNDWTPSYLWKLGKPFVWGPVGHHPAIPSQYLRPYNKLQVVKDRLTWAIKQLFWRFSGDLKRTASNAQHVLCMNGSVSSVMNINEQSHSIMPSVATGDFGHNPEGRARKFTLISAGRLVPLKGFDLCINSFASFLSKLDEETKASCELQIVGSGPEEARYKQLASDLGIAAYIRFVPWMERSELMERMKEASAFVFPSHEGAGMIVAEALSFGVPVVCLDNSGPGEFVDESCGIRVPEQDYKGTVEGLSEGIFQLFSDQGRWKAMSQKARERFEQYFHWDRRGEALQAIYQQL